MKTMLANVQPLIRRTLLRSIFWVLLPILPAQAVDSGCAELADIRDTGLPGPPGGVAQITCAAFFPFAVSLDGSESSRLEVRVVGDNITAVSLGNQFPVVGVSVNGVEFPQTGGFIDLFDDGTNGDRSAGDGVWSRGGISVSAVPLPPIRFSEFGLLRYTDDTGTHDIGISAPGNPGQYGPAKLGGLDPALRHSITNHGNGFYRTPNVVFMIDDDAHAELRWMLRSHPPAADIRGVTQRFYDFHPDSFDFILLMPGAHAPGGLAGAHLSVSNQVQGIGRPIVDNSAQWGSAGRLQSVVAVNLSDSGPVLHEIIHRWGVYLATGLGFQQCAGAHWGAVGVGRSPLGGFNTDNLVDNGDGTWSVPNADFTIGGAPADTTAMNPLDLYLAGFISAAAVPDFQIPVNIDCSSISQDFGTGLTTFAADGMATRSIQDVIDEHGARIPDVTGAQRHFEMAWIVPMNRVPTPTEAGWFQYRSEYLGREEPGTQAFRLTFREAAAGLATLNTSPDRAGRIFEDRFQVLMP